jgi:hypothetical protein
MPLNKLEVKGRGREDPDVISAEYVEEEATRGGEEGLDEFSCATRSSAAERTTRMVLFG